VVALNIFALPMPGKINWDALGIGTSLACAIHCALLPLFLTSLPVLGIEIIDNVAFEYIMIIIALAIGSFALLHGFKRHHHSALPLIFFFAGMTLLFAKQKWHQYQLWILPFAVILIVLAHLLNFRYCRVHNHAHSEDCNH
jgi:positive regulator of sigma E activity